MTRPPRLREPHCAAYINHRRPGVTGSSSWFAPTVSAHGKQAGRDPAGNRRVGSEIKDPLGVLAADLAPIVMREQ
jgi:hypothetical protein